MNTDFQDTGTMIRIYYLKATDVEVGLLLNLGPKPEIKRKVFDTSGSN
jgi:hypothetical protein